MQRSVGDAATSGTAGVRGDVIRGVVLVGRDRKRRGRRGRKRGRLKGAGMGGRGREAWVRGRHMGGGEERGEGKRKGKTGRKKERERAQRKRGMVWEEW